MGAVTNLSGWRDFVRSTFLTAGAAVILMSGTAVANDLPSGCSTRPSKVCTKWAPGASETFAGKCIQWKWVRAQCVSKGRESWRRPERKDKKW